MNRRKVSGGDWGYTDKLVRSEGQRSVGSGLSFFFPVDHVFFYLDFDLV